MADENEWYESGERRGRKGEQVRWAQVSTAIPAADVPGYTSTGEVQAPVMVSTSWTENSTPVTTQVITGMVGRLVIARNLDGSDRAALEAEHRRIVNLVKTQGPSAVSWS